LPETTLKSEAIRNVKVETAIVGGRCDFGELGDCGLKVSTISSLTTFRVADFSADHL